MLSRLRRSRRPVELPPQDRLESLDLQVARLEELVEGLQDAVHRESVRRDAEIAEVKRKLEPTALAQAISADARKRGLE